MAEEMQHSSPLNDSYELQKCVLWIEENNFNRVALQFPDNLLHLADEIALKIQKGISSALVYVLADTSYGSCCVDEVAAEHVSADAIIHFGHACLTPCNRLSVLYIFGKLAVEPNHIAAEFRQIIEHNATPFILMFEVTYYHASKAIYDAMINYFSNLLLCELDIPNSSTRNTECSPVYSKFTSGRIVKLKEGNCIEDYSIFFIGQGGSTLNNLMMTLNKCQFYSYNPIEKVARKESVNINRSLQKRYYAVERAREAHIVGILMGTLGVTKYLDIVERMKLVAKLAGKKTYTIVVGRLNPSKLANFLEIDIFVLIACPENSLLDYKEYYRPIITPFEFELACVEDRQWSGDYVIDFQQLMPGALHHIPLPESPNAEMRTSVSLINGHMNLLSENMYSLDVPDDSLVLKDNFMVSEIHNRAGGEFLTSRTWQGLQPTVGETPVADVQQGIHGTASSYEHEKNLMNLSKK